MKEEKTKQYHTFREQNAICSKASAEVQAQLSEYNRILKKSDDIYRKASRAFDLPEATLWILYFLREGSVHTQKELCEVMLQAKQSINSALKKMETEGYVMLEASDENRKSKNIVLTEKGKLLAEGTSDRIIEAEENALGKMSAAERERMLELFTQFLGLLQEEMEHLGSSLPDGRPRV